MAKSDPPNAYLRLMQKAAQEFQGFDLTPETHPYAEMIMSKTPGGLWVPLDVGAGTTNAPLPSDLLEYEELLFQPATDEVLQEAEKIPIPEMPPLKILAFIPDDGYLPAVMDKVTSLLINSLGVPQSLYGGDRRYETYLDVAEGCFEHSLDALATYHRMRRL